MADDLGERTEAPTPKKLSEARARGNVAKSTEFSAAVELIGGVVLLYYLGSWLTGGLAELMRANLQADGIGPWWSADSATHAAGWSFSRAAWFLAPFLAVIFVIAYLAQLSQVRFLWSLDPLQPKLDRINPLAGIKRTFSLRTLVKTAMSTAKLAIVAAVVVVTVLAHTGEIAALPNLSAVAAFAVMAGLLLKVIAACLLALFVLGLADWWYQVFQHTKDLRMSKQEVKDERKNLDGDPELKGRRLRIAREIALQRARKDVPTADVVVTNPTHFAVALKYDAQTMAAPTVVAKGEDWMAFRIRELAAAHGVPIVEKPALARALYAEVKVGQQVRPELYEAVAEVLAYVYRLSGRKSA